jgi:preprotein translocase subunit SecA/nephrocystin-3
MGNYPKALEYHLKALAIRERVLGTEHPDTADSYKHIGNTYYSMDDYPKALEYHLKALAIRERVLGTEHHNTANSYNNIGNTYDSMGDYPKALEYHLKALAIREHVLGVEHPDTVASFKNTGITYYKMEEYKEVIKYLLKTFTIHIDTSLFLADSYDSLGYYKDAIEYYTYYVEHANVSEEEILAIIYICMGNCHINSGYYATAKEIHQKALEIRERLTGKDSSKYATICLNLGKALTLLGEYDKGLDYLAKDIAITGEDPWISISYYWMARNYQMQGNYTSAYDNYKKALIYLEPCPDDMLHRKAEILNSFASCFLETGDIPQAEQENSRARELCERYYKGENHPLLAHILRQAGDIEAEKGNRDKALDLYRQSKAIFIHFHGEDSLYAAQVEKSLQE